MFAHHVITVSLLFLSYTYNFTRVGNVILILMDVCDVNLSIAKMLKYFHRERACDVAFVSFMLMWIYTRHILYNRVLLSALYDVPNIIEFAWKPEEEHFLTKEVQTGFVALLAALQVLLIIWFFMIVKVLIAVVSGKNAEDTRSDDEDEDE
jgi:acyl-CoA-dependent ceramide synthase